MSPIVTGICSGTGLAHHLVDHRLGQFDADDFDPASAERQRDATGTDRELECASASGELGEHIDGRIHDRLLEHLG